MDDRISLEAIDSVIDYPCGYGQADWRQHQDRADIPNPLVGTYLEISNRQSSRKLDKDNCYSADFRMFVRSSYRMTL